MSNVFDNFTLTNPGEPALAFQTGFAHGQAERQAQEVKGALAAYAANPDDPSAVATITQWKPEVGIEIIKDKAARAAATAKDAQAQRAADLQKRAAGGDAAAKAELAGVNFPAWQSLHENDQKDTHDRVTAVGDAATRIKLLPPEQQPAAWDAAVTELSGRWPELAQFKGQYSPDKVDAAIDTAGKFMDFHNATNPQYMAPQPGAPLVNVRDPAALSTYNAQVLGGAPPAAPPVKVNSIQEAQRLAPGTHFIDPNGVQRVVPGGASASRVGAGFLDGL